MEGIKRAKAETPEFEPKNFLAIQHSKEKTGMFLPVFSTMLPWLNTFRTLNWGIVKSELQFSGILNFFVMPT